MFDREGLVSTYLGESIAVPHGTIETKKYVKKTASPSANTQMVFSGVKMKMMLPNLLSVLQHRVMNILMLLQQSLMRLMMKKLLNA